MDGWIKLHRKLLGSSIFQNEKLLKVFIYCMLKASHCEHEQKIGRQTVTLKPGQFVFGRKKAAQDLDMKESTVRDYMNLLKADSVIDIKSTNKFSVITVVNWAFYQSEEKTSDNKPGAKTADKPPANGQQINTNKNGNNGKNEKNRQQQLGLDASGPSWVPTYEMHYGIPSMAVIQIMNSYLDDGLEQELIILAIEKAAENGQPFHYAKGILNKWIQKGILTVAAANAEEEEFKTRKVERIHGKNRPQSNSKPKPKYGTDRSKLDFSRARGSL